VLLAFLGSICVAGPVTPASGAEFEIVPGSFAVRMLDADGNPENRAGSHPDRLQIDFELEGDEEDGAPRDLVFEFPPGFGGNPAAVPLCSRELFEAGNEPCPEESQTGLIELMFSGGGELELPVFSIEPRPGELFSFGSVPGFDVPLTTELRPDDFGLIFTASELPKQDLSGGRLELWGVPADRQEGTSIARRALLTAPTRCGPLPFVLRTRSWQQDAAWLSASAETTPLVGCEDLDFEPHLDVQLDSPVPDTPTGVQIELTTPEEGGADELADAQIQNATIALPDGVTVSPGGAQGLVACSDAQLDLRSSAPALCPAASRIGAVELLSSVSDQALSGSVYLGEERPGERFRMFIVTSASGIVVKFVGSMQADPVSGRFSTTLTGLPQVPIRRLSLDLDGGAKALVASPLSCGPASSRGHFEPYGDGTPVESVALLEIRPRPPASQCSGPPFAPRLSVHLSSSRAGRPSTLSASLLREDGEQLPRGFALTLPAGFSARLGAVRTCGEAEVAAAACPPASRIGGLLARVGSGPNPAALEGDVYLTGGYRGAPFGFSMQARAEIGPFDLGTIAFRAAAQLDGRSGRVTVLSDPLPELVEGVSIRFQSITLSMDRRGFTRNPTSCRRLSLDATVEGTSGRRAELTHGFRLRGCRKLGFSPRFRVNLLGRDELRKGGNPSLRMSARLRHGDTNLRAMNLSLPPGLRFGIGNLEQICSRRDALLSECPDGARMGTSVARTPLLDTPLRGTVYLVQPRGNGEPDFWASLSAMGIEVEMRGTTVMRQGRPVTRLAGLPDLPLSSFTMRLGGEDSRVLSLDVDPCANGEASRLFSKVAIRGQSGLRRTLRPRIGAHCNRRAPRSERIAEQAARRGAASR